MPDIPGANIPSGRDLQQTLWHCHQCTALVAIHSAEVIESATCPICCDVKLDQRGSFETILGMSHQERSPAAS
jgi:hypothetical protein